MKNTIGEALRLHIKTKEKKNPSYNNVCRNLTRFLFLEQREQISIKYNSDHISLLLSD
jgi:hypothetical protein